MTKQRTLAEIEQIFRERAEELKAAGLEDSGSWFFDAANKIAFGEMTEAHARELFRAVIPKAGTMNFPQQLRAAIARAGGITKAAARCELTRQTLHYWLRGDGVPALATRTGVFVLLGERIPLTPAQRRKWRANCNASIRAKCRANALWGADARAKDRGAAHPDPTTRYIVGQFIFDGDVFCTHGAGPTWKKAFDSVNPETIEPERRKYLGRRIH